MDKQERLFHQSFTIPMIKKVCVFAVISLVAKNIFGSDAIVKGAIVMTACFVISRFLKGADPMHINAIAARSNSFGSLNEG
jgi:hypothetical protein